MGQRHTNFMEPTLGCTPRSGEAPQLATYPGADATSGGREYVDFFNFPSRRAMGTKRVVDDPTFRVRVNDASTGGDPVNPSSAVARREQRDGDAVVGNHECELHVEGNLTDFDGNVFDRYIETRSCSTRRCGGASSST